MIQVNRNNGNETKSGIFSWDILKSDIKIFYQKMLEYFNDFQNHNFSAL